MHITVLPASTRTASETIRALLTNPAAPNLKIRGYYRDPSRAPAEFTSHANFFPVRGDLLDASTLDFSGSDAVFIVQPPIIEDIDTVLHAKTVSEGIKAAIAKAGSVKRVVYLSSLGAQLEKGTGEILTNHAAEQVLKDAASEVVFVRAGYFMHNWEAAMETIPEAGFFFTTLTPLDFQLPHVAAHDIGETCARELLATGCALETTPYVFELHGPRAYSSLDVQTAFEQAAEKKIEMRPVDKGGLVEFYAHVFPPQLAERYAEMNTSFLPGGVLHESLNETGETGETEVRRGKTELVEVFKQFFGSA